MEKDLDAEARGEVYTCANKARRDTCNKEVTQNKSDRKPNRKPEVKCSICGKGFIPIPERKQAYSANVGVSVRAYSISKGCNYILKIETQKPQNNSENM